MSAAHYLCTAIANLSAIASAAESLRRTLDQPSVNGVKSSMSYRHGVSRPTYLDQLEGMRDQLDTLAFEIRSNLIITTHPT
jgi:hypothetical protein